MTKKITISGAKYPTATNINTITNQFHCNNTVYATVQEAITRNNCLLYEPTLVCSHCETLHLTDNNKYDVSCIAFEGGSLGRAISTYAEKAYGISNLVTDKVLHAVYYIDTSLCVIIDCFGTIEIGTRNPAVLDTLQTVYREEESETEMLKAGPEDVVNGTVPIAMLMATKKGYIVSYEKYNLNRVTVIPYSWYWQYVDGLRNSLQQGCVEICISRVQNTVTYTGTTKEFLHDNKSTTALRFIQHNPCDELRELQFYDLDSSRIEAVGIPQIQAVYFVCN